MNRILWIGPMIFALSTGLPTALCVLFGDAIVNVILKSVPVWFTNGLSIAGNMLPVVGIALLLQVMPAKVLINVDDWFCLLSLLKCTNVRCIYYWFSYCLLFLYNTGQ